MSFNSREELQEELISLSNDVRQRLRGRDDALGRLLRSEAALKKQQDTLNTNKLAVTVMESGTTLTDRQRPIVGDGVASVTGGEWDLASCTDELRLSGVCPTPTLHTHTLL